MSDPIGRRGEAAISTILGRPVDGKVIFDAKYLGAKNETFDFSVSLLGEKDRDLGPFFLLQVKATMVSNPSKSFNVGFNEGHVDKSRKSKVPTYIVAIDVSKKIVEDAYFLAIEHSHEGGIWAVPRLHNFGCDETLLMLYNEVNDYFASELSSFSSQFV